VVSMVCLLPLLGAMCQTLLAGGEGVCPLVMHPV
jgi:hypothetical protein